MSKVNVYRTVSGDTWDLIAYKLFGHEKYYKELIRNNLKLLDISIFQSNVPIIVPEITIETSTSSINSSKTPPWKVG